MDKKLGVYICSGCSIGDTLDVEALSKVAEGEYKVPVCKVHANLCGKEGVELISKDLEEGNVNSVVIAACSPRMKCAAFRFDPTKIIQTRVNLREHVSWCQKPNDEDTQMMAEDYLRMGIVRTQKAEPLEPVSDEISKRILVVGGGIAGMTSAIEAANAEYEVVLVEKKAQLGGFAATVKAGLPEKAPYESLSPNDIARTIEEVSYSSRITVYTSAKITKTDGQPGQFDVTIESDGNTVTERIGSIIMATGWKPYDATRLGHLGYGTSPDVVTSVEFEKMAAEGKITRPSDGEEPKSVLFIQCAGSRDKDHLPYCSSVCCMGTLKQSVYLHEQNPEIKAYIIYKDMRTPAQYERFYRKVQDDPSTFLTKGEIAGVENGSGRLSVSVKNTLLGEDLIIDADMVVLATGMVPNSADGEALRELVDCKLKSENAETEAQKEEAAKRVEELKAHEGTQILNLDYRQGPDLPALKYGFPDSHFVCFPYETRRTGIYAAGAVRSPMDALHAKEDALGAAMKAIQSVELASIGEAVHPRSRDMSFPDFFLQRCTQCKRCTEECPFGALNEDEKGTPQPNPYRCRRCGICMGACPERIISFKDYSVDMIASMIKAIEVPDEEDEKPRVLVFMCENDAYPALDIAGMKRIQYDPSVRVVPLRCLGSLNIVWIADALSSGFDGVMLFGCKYGDDYQCHFAKGSELANQRLENVKETLQRLQLESERVEVHQLAINEYDKLPGLIDNFMEMIREIGPNPYKGF